MSLTKAKEHLEKYGMAQRIQEFDVSSATVELAAQALDTQPQRIAKTLSFEEEGGCILIVAAGDAKVDNAKFKAQFHHKAKMLAPEAVELQTGHAIGGVCPFGVPKTAAVYLDISLQRFETVYPAAGSANSAVEMTCAELMEASGAKGWIDVCKGWQEQ